ncbi:MAG: uracil-DNA glycosylase [Flavobacteriales bacterium]
MSNKSSIEINPQIEKGWAEVLNLEFQNDYFKELKQFLLIEKRKYEVYPPSSLIFNAFNSTPFNEVKVVILGQDPYHGQGQAHGLAFSVLDGISQPPSLKNIFKELSEDLGTALPMTGNLMPWAKQGVLLLNSTLTVRKASAGSHQKHGWEQFTDAAIAALSSNRASVVFMLWGNYARSKRALIDDSKHLILEASHPSPFSAHSGFFGCRHFSRTNEYLKKRGLEPIHWSLA